MSGECFSPPVWVSPYHHISWSPLPVSTITINTNESFSIGHFLGGIEGIFRDEQGNPLLHYGKQRDVDSASQAEILIIREVS